MPTMNGIIYGYCGILCSTCKAYLSNKCPGCDAHANQCLFAYCAIRRKEKSCLGCSEFPCKLHVEGFDWDTEEFGRIRWRVYSEEFTKLFKRLG